jgi:hypothetical protein
VRVAIAVAADDDLGQGLAKEYVATLYADAPDADYQTTPQAYVIRTGKVGQRTELDVEMARGGGFAISIREATDADRKLRRLK